MKNSKIETPTTVTPSNTTVKPTHRKPRKSRVTKAVVASDVPVVVLETVVEEPVVVETIVETVANVLAGATTTTDTTQAVVTNTDIPLTKAELGRAIFAEELQNGLVRKVTIGRLMNEALLTKAGAATYFQNMKKKAGLVVAKV